MFTKHRKDVTVRLPIRQSISQKDAVGAESVNSSKIVENIDKDESNGIEKPEETGLDLIYKVNDLSHDHSFYDLATSITFNQLFFALWFISLVYRVRSYNAYDEQQNSFYSWASCAFANFNGVNQDWHDVCGTHPPYRQPFGLQLTYFAFISGQGILFSVIFLLNPSLWYSLYEKISGKPTKNEDPGYMMVPVGNVRNASNRRQTANVVLDDVFGKSDDDAAQKTYADNSSFHGGANHVHEGELGLLKDEKEEIYVTDLVAADENSQEEMV